MSTKGRGKKHPVIDASLEKATKTKKTPVKTTVPAAKASKKKPQSDGVTKQRRLKKKQSDSILKAIVDGTSLEDLKNLITELKKEERDALAKKEAKKQQQQEESL